MLIVLDAIEHYYGELQRTAALVSELSLRYDVNVSRILVSVNQWTEATSGSSSPFAKTPSPHEEDDPAARGRPRGPPYTLSW